MKNLMYETVCSDIRIAELKLKRINLNKQHLFNTKPILPNRQKLKIWQSKLEKLVQEEEYTLKKLAASYIELENFFK